MIAIRAIIDKNNCFVDIINIHIIRVLKGFFAMDRMFIDLYSKPVCLRLCQALYRIFELYRLFQP